MGCECSKNARNDIPKIGCQHTFVVMPGGGGLVVTDANQNKWMEVSIDDHLKRKEEITAMQWENWSKEGELCLTGPLGAEEKVPLMRFHCGEAKFNEVGREEFRAAGDLNDHAIMENRLWPDIWQKQDYTQINWVCVRSVSVQNIDDEIECVIGHAIMGATRVREVTQQSPRDAKVGGHRDLKNRHHMDSRYDQVAYNGKFMGEEMNIDGEMGAPNKCPQRYKSFWKLKPKNPQSSMYVDGTSIETEFRNNAHCMTIEVADQVFPLAALSMGIAVGCFMHPLEVEKYATHWCSAKAFANAKAKGTPASNGQES